MTAGSTIGTECVGETYAEGHKAFVEIDLTFSVAIDCDATLPAVTKRIIDSLSKLFTTGTDLDGEYCHSFFVGQQFGQMIGVGVLQHGGFVRSHYVKKLV